MIDSFNVTVGTCPGCDGTGDVPHPAAGEVHDCFRCNGHGVVRRGVYGSGYKTATTAARALSNGYGVECEACKGEGTDRFPLTNTCHECRGGLIVRRAMPGDYWPADVPSDVRYLTGRADVMSAYAAALDIVVTGADRSGTWNEAHLGLGTLVSVTDYGRRWDAFVAAAKAGTDAFNVARDALIADVRADIAKGTQWVKLTTDDDRLVSRVIVTVHRSGYTVRGDGSAAPRVMLPPTYTADVLNAPIR